ncbi:MAG: CocE/NonD family hydrolase, partial [Syntrophales bacterium LBB04]|nr:CocE/NonD family hydrolase [Syntrophales bacterium LBB04]
GEDGFIPTKDEVNEALETWKTHALNINNHIQLALNPVLEYDGDFINPRSSMLYWPEKPEGGWTYYGYYINNPQDPLNEKVQYPLYPAGAKIPEGERVIPSKLPIFMLGGWYCIFTKGTLNHYIHGLSQHSSGDKALVMGPWYHLDGSMGLGLPDFYKTQAIAARWFD